MAVIENQHVLTMHSHMRFRCGVDERGASGNEAAGTRHFGRRKRPRLATDGGPLMLSGTYILLGNI